MTTRSASRLHVIGTCAAQVVDEQFVGLVVPIAAITQHRRRMNGRHHDGLRC